MVPPAARSAHRRVVIALTAVGAGLLAAFAPVAGASTGAANAAGAASSYTPSSYAVRLLQLVNGARAEDGLRSLQPAAGTTTVAAHWTDHLATTQTLAHNPQLRHDLETHGSPNWTAYGENVGRGTPDDPDALFRAYMASPEHRANILTGAFRYVGVAVDFSGGLAWNTFDFVDSYGAAAPAQTAGGSGSSTSGGRIAGRSRPAQPAAASRPARPAVVVTTTPHRSPPAPLSRRQPPRRHAVAAAPLPARALRIEWARPLPAATVPGLHEVTPPAAGQRVVAPAAPVSAAAAAPVAAIRGSRAVIVAIAVWMVVAVARRWLLVAAPGRVRTTSARVVTA
ncbi:MAG TPA: CAP domain-containing protein [Mycobacteriales bacterium]|nr:CAP domain-containing protein [Mycobacteriales bacterium]